MTSQLAAEGVRVGLEIHQQIASPTKLFCACPTTKSEEFPNHFERRLRPAQSELGRIDPAAIFEYSKAKSNLYLWNPESSCLVEADEEPPHPLSEEGLDSALLVAKTLGSNLVDEVHVMRKIVIDGSNTSGFQRTAVVGIGGSFKVDGTQVGVQSVTLEEDAARILGEDESSRRFALDRLGVALVEVALDPVPGDPEFVAKVALHLGRALRSTERVARGLGTIRQDLNVSLTGGRVVEVKGVQKLNLLPKVVEYERKRQLGLVRIAEKLSEKGLKRIKCRARDVTKVMAGTASKVARRELDDGGKVVAIVAPGLGGLMGWEPYQDIRLGKEVAEIARSNSLGGIIHSDEFRRQGLSEVEEANLRAELSSGADDAIILVAGRPSSVERCAPLLIARLEESVSGVPAETRAATEAGETKYMRPRPGSQRMYPETDIPDITITPRRRSNLAEQVPEDWQAKVARLKREYSLSEDLAVKIYDSDMSAEFEELSRELSVEPSVIASVLVDLPSRLAREGVPESALGLPVLSEVLRAVDSGQTAKEAVPDILKAASTRGISISQAIGVLGVQLAGESQVRGVVESVLQKHRQVIEEKGDGAFSLLMGEAMKDLRGKADGAVVSRILREKLAELAAKKAG
ncbi:MAG TPA: Glu-tRNA(Gln) amidotransferase subunit GatE [Nitrososphaerales archaeon]|nr:Glu-tRNA(Gln) amidotransferase subunit GatE [Nitrososphaerales archaeon]